MADKIETLDTRSYTTADYYPVKTLLELSGIYNPLTDTKEFLEFKLLIDPGSIIIAENEKQIIGCIFFTRTSDTFIIDKLAPLTEDPDSIMIRLDLLFMTENIALHDNYSEISIVLPNIQFLKKEMHSNGYTQSQSNIWTKSTSDIAI